MKGSLFVGGRFGGQGGDMKSFDRMSSMKEFEAKEGLWFEVTSLGSSDYAS